jgi:acetylglutamate kinase
VTDATAPRPAGGDVVVVKLGGETLAEQHDTLRGVAALAGDYRLVIVHGGGKRLTSWLERLGIESRWHEGRRVTDDAALEVAVAVLGGLVNGELVASLIALGCDAVGLSGIDGGLIVAERIPELGRVARVVDARPGLLQLLLDAKRVPVVATLAIDGGGAICNVNADEVAAGLAGALSARLVMLSDTDGVRDGDRRIDSLDAHGAEELIADGRISGGMIPKVRGALRVLEAGASEVVIADGRTPNALERALSDPTFGTHIVRPT